MIPPTSMDAVSQRATASETSGSIFLTETLVTFTED